MGRLNIPKCVHIGINFNSVVDSLGLGLLLGLGLQNRKNPSVDCRITRGRRNLIATLNHLPNFFKSCEKSQTLYAR